ncbi:lipase [Dyella sp.]|uniref:lipase n=1 Tax=Dyella sp. TaxID=1869338 RepID=UPI002ED0FB8F
MSIKQRLLGLLALLLLSPIVGLHATCVDNVVLVHGNTGSPADFQNTVDLLLQNGYTSSQIFAPAWGNSLCAACNDHNGSEETPVRNAINSAIASSCTGHIDVIGHSMGATLAALEITKLNAASKVDVFLGIAGAFHGLYTCGIYPFNTATLTCGQYGLSISSPLLNGLDGKRFGKKEYTFISWVDEINCATGTCLVYGVHTSTIDGEDGSTAYPYEHYQLLYATAADQLALIRQ